MQEPTANGIDPGPIRSDLLTLQHSHRSRYIWAGHLRDDQLTIRRSDSKFWQNRPFDHRIEELIDRAGFGGVRRLCYMKIDHALITALVERWRQETHTFHLIVGEATVTLQDVEVLFGLRVDGEPIYYSRYSQTLAEWPHTLAQWQEMCYDLLGFRPTTTDLDGCRMKLIALEGPLSQPLPPDATPQMVAQHARCRIMQLIGGFLFSDKSGNKVHLRFLMFLRDLEHSGSLSWGSAVLAHLYHCLCSATVCTARVISGPLLLLQLWAWERIPTMRPGNIHPRIEMEQEAPRGARWEGPLELFHTPRQVLVVYRDQLDRMRPDHFIWQPYTNQILQSLPPDCTHGRDIWRSVTSLICWETLELHCPNRVMRQFGFVQTIPVAIDTKEDLHSRDMRSSGASWDDIDAYHVSEWASRRDRVYAGQPTADVTVAPDDYSKWYWLHTRRLIGNPTLPRPNPTGYQPSGGTVEILVDAIHRILYIGNDAPHNADSLSRQAFASIADICTHTLTAIGEGSRLSRPPIEPSRRLHTSEPVPPIPPHRVDTNEPFVHRGSRRARQHVAANIPQPHIDPDARAHHSEGDQGEDVDGSGAHEDVDEAGHMVHDNVVTPQHPVFDTRCLSSPDMIGGVDNENAATTRNAKEDKMVTDNRKETNDEPRDTEPDQKNDGPKEMEQE